MIILFKVCVYCKSCEELILVLGCNVGVVVFWLVEVEMCKCLDVQQKMVVDFVSLFILDEDDDGFVGMQFFGVVLQVSFSQMFDLDMEQCIVVVKVENLIGWQLCMVGWIVVMYEIQVSLDYEVVVLLCDCGIDLFYCVLVGQILLDEVKNQCMCEIMFVLIQCLNILKWCGIEIVFVVFGQMCLFLCEVLIEDCCVSEIMKIQCDIVWWCWCKLMMLVVCLLVFVGILMIVVGYYYFWVVMLFYVMESQFQIQQVEQVSVGGLGGLFLGM